MCAEHRLQRGPRRIRRAEAAYRAPQQRRRGRPRKQLSALQIRVIVAVVRRHPTIGLPSLRRRIPGLPKNATAAFLRWLKTQRGKRRRCRLRKLRWLQTGAVWAIDGTWLDVPVVGGGRRVLIVIEVRGGTVIAFDSVPGERAGAVVACLRRLFAVHGPPLVLKADNGSAFRSRAVAALCRRHGVTLLHSPVRRPSYNGAVEVSGRWAKRRVMAAAGARGAAGALSPEDLVCAVTQVGALPAVGAEQRQRFLTAVAEQRAVARSERGLAADGDLSEHVRRTLERVAVRRALESCHLLVVEGRPYQQWFPRALVG